jgi:hypothetical protein
MTNTASAPLELIFTYGQTRERYAMQENEPPRHFQTIQQFVKHEHLPDLKQSILGDSSVLNGNKDVQWQLQLRPISRQCLWELHSGILIRLIENISGHTHLVPDAQCRYLAIHVASDNSVLNTLQTDNNTGLPVCLNLYIGLLSGSAILCAENNRSIHLQEPTLQMAFFSYSGDEI